MISSDQYRMLYNLVPITDFNKQNFLQKVLSAAWEATSEISCEGFHPLLRDDYEFGDFLVTAFETIGADKSAEICKRALSITFPEGIPETEKARVATVKALSTERYEALNSLSDEFDGADEIYDLLYQFVLRHPEEFGELPDV